MLPGRTQPFVHLPPSPRGFGQPGQEQSQALPLLRGFLEGWALGPGSVHLPALTPVVLCYFGQALHGFIIAGGRTGGGRGDGALLPAQSLVETGGLPGPVLLRSALWPAPAARPGGTDHPGRAQRERWLGPRREESSRGQQSTPTPPHLQTKRLGTRSQGESYVLESPLGRGCRRCWSLSGGAQREARRAGRR